MTKQRRKRRARWMAKKGSQITRDTRAPYGCSRQGLTRFGALGFPRSDCQGADVGVQPNLSTVFREGYVNLYSVRPEIAQRPIHTVGWRFCAKMVCVFG